MCIGWRTPKMSHEVIIEIDEEARISDEQRGN